ncbi:MAG: HAD family hydrolase, partial [Gammaproteobacteria bacterium]|nr:HAD family hydrolase [Gammaproteobacteria bacterium]
MTNTDPGESNHSLFWRLFEQRTGLDPAELEPYFAQFYREQFPKLASITQKRPAAASLLKTCFELDLQVVIATNPMFPISAIEERLAWA